MFLLLLLMLWSQDVDSSSVCNGKLFLEFYGILFQEDITILDYNS